MQRSQIMQITSSDKALFNFFYFHGMYNGDGFHCWNIAHRLGEDFRLFVVHPHGFDGGGIPRTIRDMAEALVDQIRSIQPEGPYYLGGFCVGGLIAYETACLLMAEGETIGKIVVVSAVLPPASSAARLASSLRNFATLPLRAKLLRGLRMFKPIEGKDFDGNPLAERKRKAYQNAYKRYTPSLKQREVVCVWGDVDEVNDLQSRLRWRSAATTVRDFYVRGDRFCVERSPAQVSEIIVREIVGAP